MRNGVFLGSWPPQKHNIMTFRMVTNVAFLMNGAKSYKIMLFSITNRRKHNIIQFRMVRFLRQKRFSAHRWERLFARFGTIYAK